LRETFKRGRGTQEKWADEWNCISGSRKGGIGLVQGVSARERFLNVETVFKYTQVKGEKMIRQDYRGSTRLYRVNISVSEWGGTGGLKEGTKDLS